MDPNKETIKGGTGKDDETENDPQKSGEMAVTTKKYGTVKAETTKVKRIRKHPLATTRRKMKSFRRNLKKLWDLWSGFTGTTKPASSMQPISNDQTIGVPGFEEISCIEVEMPDLMMTDTNKIRTSCKQCIKNPPKFPTKEQVKSKLIAADKYYGITKKSQKPRESRPMTEYESLEHEGDYYNDDGTIVRPSWRFILERPLVEQYVLMTNYIRKISILSELESGPKFEFIEEEEKESHIDLEQEKFKEQHILGTQQLIAGMKQPPKKDMSVQTTIQMGDDLNEGVSEVSLYPDSNVSSESSQSREQSATTIVTSMDLSSPLPSDLENRTIAETVRVKNAVKWWESKDPPQTSDSFQTSCDSAKNTSGSGSDGMSIPVHSAIGATSLFKQVQPAQRAALSPGISTGTVSQKKVTFSPVVQYYPVPQKGGGVYSIPLPKEEEDCSNDQAPDEKVTDPKLNQNRIEFINESSSIPCNSDTQNVLRNLNNTKSPKQKEMGMQTHSRNKHSRDIVVSPEIVKKAKSELLTKPVQTRIGNTRETLTSQMGDDQRTHSENKYDTFNNREAWQSDKNPSSEFNARQLERSPLSPRKGRASEENKESTSSSNEGLALKASPAVIFRHGEMHPAITSYSTDDFYPEVPELDGHIEGKYVSPSHNFSNESRIPIIVGCIPKSPNRNQIPLSIPTDRRSNKNEFVKIVVVNQSHPQKGNLSIEQGCGKLRIKSELTDHLKAPKKEPTGGNIQDKAQIILHKIEGVSSKPQKQNISLKKYVMTEDSTQQNIKQDVDETKSNEPGASHLKKWKDMQSQISSKFKTKTRAVLLNNVNSIPEPPNEQAGSMPCDSQRETSFLRTANEPNFCGNEGLTRQSQATEFPGYIQNLLLDTLHTSFRGKEPTRTLPICEDGTAGIGNPSMRKLTIQKRLNSTMDPKAIAFRSDIEHHHSKVCKNEMFSHENPLGAEARVETELNTVTHTHPPNLLENYVLHKISEETNDSNTENQRFLDRKIRFDPAEEIMLSRNRSSNFSVNVIKGSQIYSSSSSFITPSEENMALGLTKMKGTLFHPIMMEDNLIIDISADIPSQELENESEQEVSIEIENSNNQSSNIGKLEFSPIQQRIFQPCFNLMGNLQNVILKDVEIKTATSTQLTVEAEEHCEKETNAARNEIKTNIETVLQRVHEAVNEHARTKNEAVENNTNASDEVVENFSEIESKAKLPDEAIKRCSTAVAQNESNTKNTDQPVVGCSTEDISFEKTKTRTSEAIVGNHTTSTVKKLFDCKTVATNQAVDRCSKRKMLGEPCAKTADEAITGFLPKEGLIDNSTKMTEGVAEESSARNALDETKAKTPGELVSRFKETDAPIESQGKVADEVIAGRSSEGPLGGKTKTTEEADAGCSARDAPTDINSKKFDVIARCLTMDEHYGSKAALHIDSSNKTTEEAIAGCSARDSMPFQRKSEVTDIPNDSNTKTAIPTVLERNTKATCKQWLMDVIPTIVKNQVISKKDYKPSMTQSKDPNTTIMFSSREEAAKPVFKFLKRQKEMEKNNND